MAGSPTGGRRLVPRSFAPGFHSGETALACLALLKAGRPHDDPVVLRGFAWLLEQPLAKTYDVAVSVMALEALHAPKPEPPAAGGIVKTPYRALVRKQFEKNARAPEKKWLLAAAAWLVDHRAQDGLWAYPEGDADLSNTSLALLALESARRLGVDVPREVWAKALDGVLQAQESDGPAVAAFEVPAADGPIGGSEAAKPPPKASTQTRVEMHARGFSYKRGQSPTGSMTAAGVASLVLIKGALEGTKAYETKDARRVDAGLRDGAAWLARRGRADANPGAEPLWHFYWLYTLERAGTLARVERFGERAWYAEGEHVLLARQRDDGRFESAAQGESDAPVVATSFAVLFLKRGTVPVIERTVTLTGTGR